MHIITRRKLLEAGQKDGTLAVPLDAWYRIAKAAQWASLQEVRQAYSHADAVRVKEKGKDSYKVYTVFNISGNSYRLVTEIFYETQTILLRHVLTHAEYDKQGWKK